MNAPTQPAKPPSTGRPPLPEGATDVSEFIESLDGGNFDRALAVALSRVAAASIDNNVNGEITIKLKLVPIEGAMQVRVEHSLSFKRPTEAGEASEKMTRKTNMHVGKFGRMSIAPENQLDMFTNK